MEIQQWQYASMPYVHHFCLEGITGKQFITVVHPTCPHLSASPFIICLCLHFNSRYQMSHLYLLLLFIIIFTVRVMRHWNRGGRRSVPGDTQGQAGQSSEMSPWLSCKCPCSFQGSWTRWPLRVLSNTNKSVILLHGSAEAAPQKPLYYKTQSFTREDLEKAQRLHQSCCWQKAKL